MAGRDPLDAKTFSQIHKKGELLEISPHQDYVKLQLRQAASKLDFASGEVFQVPEQTVKSSTAPNVFVSLPGRSIDGYLHLGNAGFEDGVGHRGREELAVGEKQQLRNRVTSRDLEDVDEMRRHQRFIARRENQRMGERQGRRGNSFEVSRRSVMRFLVKNVIETEVAHSAAEVAFIRDVPNHFQSPLPKRG